jgi:7-cyano-7-deazaguanine synthase
LWTWLGRAPSPRFSAQAKKREALCLSLFFGKIGFNFRKIFLVVAIPVYAQCMSGATSSSVKAKPAVILLSGGLDSSTVLAIAKCEGFLPYAMTFRYGQRHSLEIEAAKKIAKRMGVEKHVVADIDLRTFGGSALTAEIDVPKGRESEEMQREIPITYVPARNTIFLSFALAWAEVLESSDIFIGVNAVDFSGYPDCRPEYIEAYERMANFATKAAVEGRKLRIHTPLINLSKAEIIARGVSLGVDYSLTTSCYDPNEAGEACGRCDACLLRRKGFEQYGIVDPILYSGQS